MRLYVPKEWSDDPPRCDKVGMPKDLLHQKKWEIALDLIDASLAEGCVKRPVLADAGYGNSVAFRDELRKRSLHYVVGVDGNHHGWPSRSQAKGRESMTFREIANLERHHIVEWRKGSKGTQKGCFAAIRLNSAERQRKQGNVKKEQWLISEWRKGEDGPTKFYLSSLPKNTPLRELVKLIKLRWRVERDYQEMKQEIGLDHYEGRTWPGIHHHFALCSVAHYFLALTRESFSP
jgi:SRSO17 transposase